MRAGVLFSGGKDSCLALHIAKDKYDVACLLTIFSKNPYSYMFHTSNIKLTKIQSEALDIPILTIDSSGKKELELQDLKNLILEAKNCYEIDTIVSGAIASSYQAKRIESLCKELKLNIFNPLWNMSQIKVVEEVLKRNFEVIITSIAAYPLDCTWLGKKIDYEILQKLKELETKFGLNPAGEGGEFETLVLDAPLFKKKIKIIEFEKHFDNNNYSGLFKVKKAILSEK
ncbi:MAG: diphthine--ammonia ligase [Candidatus Diapherotrites archaeon]